MVAVPTSVEIFCSYAHEDEVWRQKLETHLSLLKRQGLISLWHDRLIAPGTDWAKTIDAHLETASVILLLVSADFFASDYCYGIEMQRAMARQEVGEARVIPILVRPADRKDAPFAHLQSLPNDARPIVSWQDEDTALADVAAGIRRAIEDLDQLAVSAPTSSFPQVWNIPYPRNPFFTGRDALLTQLATELRAGQAMALSQPQSISGLGGVGKTQIAVEYAYRFRDDYQAILWARAESQEALTSSFVSIAPLLNLPQKDEQDQAIIVEAVITWLQRHQQWLLILDNADDLAAVSPFLPPIFEGHLLLTTRAQAMGRLAHKIEVDVLSPEMGALFLLRRAGILAEARCLEDAQVTDREHALQITQELGGLPLALDQAGAYLEETGCSLAAYQHLYQQHRRDLLGRRGGRVDDHPGPVATTWALSFAQVEQANPAAADLLYLCAFLAPDAIPEEIITQGAVHLGPRLSPVAADPFLFNQAIEMLRAYSLIARDPQIQMLTVHRLVQAVLRDTLPTKRPSWMPRFVQRDRHREIQQQWVQRAILAINAALPKMEFANWPIYERILPHALLCTIWIEQASLATPEAAHLLNQAGYYLYDRGRYAESEPLFRRALAIREQQLGPLHPDTAWSLNNLAALSDRQGKYEQAEPLYQRALAIHEQQLGPQHPDTAWSLNNLAYLYAQQGRYERAEPLHQRALAIREQQLGPLHPDTAQTLSNLAALYRRQGKYEEAMPLCQRALAIREQQLGPLHPDTATCLNNLALLYAQQGRYEQAEPLYQRARSIREQQLGSLHPDTAQTLSNLALLYWDQGKYEEAMPLHQRALAIREQQLGPLHPDTAVSLNNLALLYAAQGKYEQAEPLYRRALAIDEKVYGLEHPDVVVDLNNLAELYRKQGKYEVAEPLYQRARSFCEQQLGPLHPYTAGCLGNLAKLYRDCRNYAEAEPLLQRALRICEQVLGLQHPTTVEMIYGLAQLREAQGNSEEARTWYARALEIRKQAIGTHHPKTTETRTRLIALLHTLGQHEEATQLEATQANQTAIEQEQQVHAEE